MLRYNPRVTYYVSQNQSVYIKTNQTDSNIVEHKLSSQMY